MVLKTLTTKVVVRESHPDYKKLDNLCFLGKNLYNATLYHLLNKTPRPVLGLKRKSKKSVEDSKKTLKVKTQGDLYSFMRELAPFNKEVNDFNAFKGMIWTAQAVVLDLEKDYFQKFKDMADYKVNPKKYSGRPKLPKYLNKTKGRVKLRFKPKVIGNKVKLNKELFFNIPPNITGRIREVHIIPKKGFIEIAFVYQDIVKDPLESRGRYMSIDLGLNNFATLTNNIGASFKIINGKPLKSYNQNWNKRVSQLRSVNALRNPTLVERKSDKALIKITPETRKLKNLTMKRNNYMDTKVHQISSYIVKEALQLGIDTIVVGDFKGIKKKQKMTKRVKQQFQQMPYTFFLKKLAYKCELEGIRFILVEESYTSKTSFLDGEFPCKQESYLGKRVKRGLFESSGGFKINADVNGSLQILKKVFPEAYVDGIGAYTKIQVVKFDETGTLR